MPTAMKPSREITKTIKYYVSLDNYEPMPRSDHYGTISVWEDSEDATYVCYRLEPELPFFDKARNSVFLLDDGVTILPLYAGGYQPQTSEIYLFPFPTNYTREDGREIDFSTWALGPRTCFHLKVRK